MGLSKKILVTGAGGLLGSEFGLLAQDAHFQKFQIIPTFHSELDITDLKQLEENIEKLKPQFIINCAAYTQVDRAESEPHLATKINAQGPQILAESCLKHGIKLIHYSTDFVFDGTKNQPYLESDRPNPLNIYGLTKLEGEKIIQSILPKDQYLILRISWPYGKNGKNFIHSLWELSKSRSELRVVSDQIGVPNSAGLLAQTTFELLEKVTGLFHLSCKGACSRFELIRFLLSNLKSSCKVIPVTSEEFPSPAKRPAYSVLSTERGEILRALQLPFWQDALLKYLKEIQCR